jgi:hypothetical protein
MMDCAMALEVCGSDHLLAEGYLKYMGCAINVRPKEGETQREAYMNWVMEKAREWKQVQVERREENAGHQHVHGKEL